MASNRAVNKAKANANDRSSASPVNSPSESSTSGSKASSPSESVDYRFISFGHPQDTKEPKFRQTVRSHVTSRQHQNQRRALEQRNRGESSSSAVARPSSGPSSGASEAEDGSPEASSPSPSPSVERPPASIARINPTDVYPVAWHAFLRPVMDHYLDHMCIDTPDTSSNARKFLRTNFLALIFTDPAPLHALMLVAAAHMSKLHGSSAHNINLLQLKGMAIQEINRALMDHRTTSASRATGDAIAVAVAKMATFELCFGQRDTFHTHMMGLLRIVSLRGGLHALGMNGAIERALLWIDINANAILECPLYFPPAAFASSIGHPRADKRLFMVGI